MMNILNLAKEIDGKSMKGLFICDLRHFNGIEKLAGDLGVETEQIKIKRTIKEIEREMEEEIEIEVPEKEKEKQK
jgi:hypothetical protein